MDVCAIQKNDITKPRLLNSNFCWLRPLSTKTYNRKETVLQEDQGKQARWNVSLEHLDSPGAAQSLALHRAHVSLMSFLVPDAAEPLQPLLSFFLVTALPLIFFWSQWLRKFQSTPSKGLWQSHHEFLPSSMTLMAAMILFGYLVDLISISTNPSIQVGIYWFTPGTQINVKGTPSCSSLFFYQSCQFPKKLSPVCQFTALGRGKGRLEAQSMTSQFTTFLT